MPECTLCGKEPSPTERAACKQIGCPVRISRSGVMPDLGTSLNEFDRSGNKNDFHPGSIDPDKTWNGE